MIIDIFTYSKASTNASFSVNELIEGAKSAHLDGICVTDRVVSSHAKDLVMAGKNAGLFVGVGLELETAAGRVVAYPKNVDDEFVGEAWKCLGDKPQAEDVLNYFHQRGGIVIARDIYNRGEGMKDNLFHIKDDEGRGFDGVDTIAAYRRRIDNELTIEAQQVAKMPACAGSGAFESIDDIGCCATLFAASIADQAQFVEAMQSRSHWACTLRDLADACPMGSAPKLDDDRDDRRSDRRTDRGERNFKGADRRGNDRRDRDRRGNDRRSRDRRSGDKNRRNDDRRGARKPRD